jgi:hypothetical protein
MDTIYIEFDFRHLGTYIHNTTKYNITFEYGTDWDVILLNIYKFYFFTLNHSFNIQIKIDYDCLGRLY